MDVFTLESLCLLLIAAFPLLIFISKSKPSSSNQRSQGGPKTYPLIGVLPEFIKNRHRLLEWVTEVLTNSPTQTMVFKSPGHTTGILTANPEVVEYVLETNFGNFPKGDRTLSMMMNFPKGIFNSDGEDWKSQRKTASYKFDDRSLRNLVMETVRFEIVNTQQIPTCTRSCSGVLNLQVVLQRFAFDHICKVAYLLKPWLRIRREEAHSRSDNFRRSSGRRCNTCCSREKMKKTQIDRPLG